MRSLCRNALVMILGVWGVVGCEWQGGSGGVGSNVSAGYAASFAGTYVAPGGGYVVALAAASGFTNVNTSQQIGTGPVGGGTHFQNTLSHTPVVPGSVSVSWTGGVAGDDSKGNLVKSGNVGTINYQNGFIDIATVPSVAVNVPVIVTYAYVANSTPGTTPGVTTLALQQQGDTITITDNNGTTYSGTISPSLTSAGGALTTANDGDTITSQFSVSGQNAAGVNVTMTGNLQATAKGAAATATAASTVVFINRKIFGTWIDSNGVTASVNGIAN